MPKILGYDLSDESKFHRAINGSISRGGKLEGGVSEDASDELKLAAYDRLAGLIKKGTRTIKYGCFCDIEESKLRNNTIAYEDPAIIFIHRDADGNEYEFDEDEEEPEEVKLDNIAKKNKSKVERDKVEGEATERKLKFDASTKTSALKKAIREYNKKIEKETKKEAKKEAAKKEKEAKDKVKEIK